MASKDTTITDADDDSETEFTDEPPKPSSRGEVRFQDDQDSYADKTRQPADPTKAARYRNRRLAITVKIPEVDNNVDRLAHLANEVNEFIKAARTKKETKFRLRAIQDTSIPNYKDRKSWLTVLPKDSVSDFQQYVYGYFPFTPPRGGTYRLRINTVMDDSIELFKFITNVTHDWGHKDSRSISDLKSQGVWDPVKLGYFMRASRFVTHSYELVESLEKAAKKEGFNIPFGISWGTIPSPVGGYDKDTAVQGVLIESNKANASEAVSLLHKWYPLNASKPATPPYPANFRFVVNKDNDRVKGNPVAIANLSILMERQGIFNNDTKGEQSFCIKDVTAPWKGPRTISVRQKLLSTKAKTLSKELNGRPLFLSISTSVNNRSGMRSVWFTYHKQMEKEALSIVKNLPIFIKTEWKIDPEQHCYGQFLQDGDKWDSDLRVANNEDTEDIELAVKEQTLDLKREEESAPNQEVDNMSMTSKAHREMRRMLHQDDETVPSLSKERKRHTPDSIEIDATSQAVSGMSAASSKTSVIKAKLQEEFNSKMAAQQQRVDEITKAKAEQEARATQLEEQMQQMQKMLATLQKKLQDAPTSVCAQGSQPTSSLTDSNGLSSRSDKPPEHSTPATISDHPMETTETHSEDALDRKPSKKETRDSAEDEAKAMDDDSPIIGDTMATVTQTDEEASESLQRLYEYIYEGLVSQLIEPTEADLEAAADTAKAEAIRLNDSLLDSNTSGLRSMSYATDDDPLESMDISENDPLSSKLPDSRDSEDEPMPPPPADPPPLRRSTRNSNRGANPGPAD